MKEFTFLIAWSLYAHLHWMERVKAVQRVMRCNVSAHPVGKGNRSMRRRLNRWILRRNPALDPVEWREQ